MQVQITEASVNDETGSVYITADCGKVSAFVFFTSHNINVICRNPSHRVWRGAGKFFPTITEATEGYKSAAMKAIILAANEAASMVRANAVIAKAAQ